ncbi:MAG: LamG domain-containing protein, partial [Methylococcales bacterium]|nr:LamG domain-containing protein [Methylococcales bacterium]
DEGSGVKLYDATPNNNDGTMYYMSTSTRGGWTEGRFGSALSFDGSDDYVNVADSNSLDLTTAVTMEAWVRKVDPIGSNWQWIITKGRAYALGYRAWDGKIAVCGSPGGSFNNGMAVSSVALTSGVWTHIVATWVTAGTTKLYFNGVEVGSGNNPGDIAATVDILAINSLLGTAEYIKADIDDVRIYNYARTEEQIRQDYNAGLAARLGSSGKDCNSDPASCISDGLVGYWSMDERNGDSVADFSGNSNNGIMLFMSTSTNSAWITGVKPFSGGQSGGGAISFDGSDDFVNITDVASLDFGAGQDFTLETWIKISGGSGSRDIFTKGGTGDSDLGYWLIISGTNKVEVGLSDGNDLRALGTSQNTVVDGRWHHVVGVFDRDDKCTIYIDGKINGSPFSISSEGDISNSYNLNIGRYVKNSSEYFSGLIDEVRIYNRVLSAEEVRYHYNKGGPVGWWKFNESSGTKVYDTTNNNNDGIMYWMSTSTGGGWVEGKYGSALSFDGVDDYVTLGSGSSISSLNDLTFEAWVNPKADYGKQLPRIIDAYYSLWITASNGLVTFRYQNAVGQYSDVSDSSALPVGSWTHLVATYSSVDNKPKLYRNGVLVATGNVVLGPTGSATVHLGDTGLNNRNFNGLIDDVRIYNYARTQDQIFQDYNAGLSIYFK